MKSSGKRNNVPVRLAERRIFSASFWPLYEEGMRLVEEVAAYLDGEGREEARDLRHEISGLHAAESMRLTTRLMQIASWLLLQRAAHSGEMTRDQVAAENARVRLDTPSAMGETEGWSELPERFAALVAHSLRLQRLVQRMDEEIYLRPGAPEEPGANPVSEQIHLLHTVFSHG